METDTPKRSLSELFNVFTLALDCGFTPTTPYLTAVLGKSDSASVPETSAFPSMKFAALACGAVSIFLMTSVSAGPNLTPDIQNFTIQMDYLGELSEVQDGCIPNGTHNVLRFDFISKNIGDADFVAGRPLDRPDLFYYHLSHHHFHMREFNQYKLVQTNGTLSIPSTKPGFCLADVEQLSGNETQQFSILCPDDVAMGVSAGWADVYSSDLLCQYLVIDDVPDGDYVLIAITNAARKVPEDTFADNTISKGLHIQGQDVWETTIPADFTYVATQSPTTSVASTSVQASQTAAMPASNAGPTSANGVPTLQSSAAASVSVTQEFSKWTIVALTLSLCWNLWI